MDSKCNTKSKISLSPEENLKMSVSSGKLSPYAGEYPFKVITGILVTTDDGLIIAGEKVKMHYCSIVMVNTDSKMRELESTITVWIEDMTWVKEDEVFAYIDSGAWINSTVHLLKIDKITRKVSEVAKFSTDVSCKALAYLDSHFLLFFPKSMRVKIVTIQGDIKYVISSCDNCGWGKMSLPALEGFIFIDGDYKLYVFCSYTLFIFDLDKDDWKVKSHTAKKTAFLDRILAYDHTRLLLASRYSGFLTIVSRGELDTEGRCRMDLSGEKYYPEVLGLHGNELLVGRRGESDSTLELKVFQLDVTPPNTK